MTERFLDRRAPLAAAFVALAAGAVLGLGGGPSQQAKLTASDGVANNYFGIAVALAGDTAVVGASRRNFSEGAAYVFTRTGSTWAQQAKLVAGDPANAGFFGESVAVAGDTAVVGSTPAGVGTNEAAYVFTRSGTAWTQQAKLLIGAAVANPNIPVSVAIEGDTIVAGSPTQRKAFVFTRAGTTWTPAATLTGSDSTPLDAFGFSVALDGGTAVVGAYGTQLSHGAAYVFTGAGSNWTQQQKLTAPDGANADVFGTAVALKGDSAVVGAPGKNGGKGAAYVFTRSAGVWTPAPTLRASDEANGGSDGFGGAAAVAGDTVVLSAIGRNNGQGAAYVFGRSGAAWTEKSKFAAGDPSDSAFFGTSVALSDDAALALLGAYAKDAFQGAAYVFALTGGSAPQSGYCLVSKAKAKANAKRPASSTITVSGTLDTGSGVPDFSGAATFDVGGFHLVVPAFVAKGKSLTHAAGGVTLTITPAKTGSSHATFSVKAVGDLSNKVDLNAPLVVNFKNAALDLSGTANLTAGALRPHAVAAPTLFISSAAATVKGGGKDSLKLALGFATDGVVPAAAEDLTICFGGTYTTSLTSGWVRKGSAWIHTAKAPGITKATVDYAKGTITIAGSGLDLGTFTDGGNAVVVTAVRGSDTRSVGVRMSRAGTKLSY